MLVALKDPRLSVTSLWATAAGTCVEASRIVTTEEDLARHLDAGCTKIGEVTGLIRDLTGVWQRDLTFASSLAAQKEALLIEIARRENVFLQYSTMQVTQEVDGFLVQGKIAGTSVSRSFCIPYGKAPDVFWCKNSP